MTQAPSSNKSSAVRPTMRESTTPEKKWGENNVISFSKGLIQIFIVNQKINKKSSMRYLFNPMADISGFVKLSS